MTDECGPDTEIPELFFYCSALRLYVSRDGVDVGLIRRTALQLCALSHVRALPPERLLILIKGGCMGIDAADSELHAVSSEASFRYHRGLDVLWTAFFAEHHVER